MGVKKALIIPIPYMNIHSASIPTDMNNNSDILSKAMEMSDITSDIMMEL